VENFSVKRSKLQNIERQRNKNKKYKKEKQQNAQ
jgi:hypothetical protein